MNLAGDYCEPSSHGSKVTATNMGQFDSGIGWQLSLVTHAPSIKYNRNETGNSSFTRECLMVYDEHSRSVVIMGNSSGGICFFMDPGDSCTNVSLLRESESQLSHAWVSYARERGP